MDGRPTKWISGFGRSGTTWIAVVLARATEEGHFYHEPCIPIDKHGALDTVEGNHDPVKWWTKVRTPVVLERMREDREKWAKSPWYGEANSLIRYNIPVVRKLYPDAPVLHLHRDGREVVRSLHARVIYSPRGGINNQNRPQPGDPWYDQWSGFDRFEKLCWFWQHGVMFMDPLADSRIEFRTMLTDFDYFTEAVSDPIGIPVSREHWEDYRRPKRKKNHTRKFTLPHHDEWGPTMTRQFWAICGDAMDLLGYKGD